MFVCGIYYVIPLKLISLAFKRECNYVLGSFSYALYRVYITHGKIVMVDLFGYETQDSLPQIWLTNLLKAVILDFNCLQQ
jgi:hypothetical protein